MTDKEPYNPSQFRVEQVSDRLFQIIHPHGLFSFMFDPTTKVFEGDWLEVYANGHENYRRQGIGQNLLRHGEKVARELGASVLTYPIASREAVDASVAVFGKESVSVKQLGAYEVPDQPLSEVAEDETRATLTYDLTLNPPL